MGGQGKVQTKESGEEGEQKGTSKWYPKDHWGSVGPG